MKKNILFIAVVFLISSCVNSSKMKNGNGWISLYDVTCQRTLLAVQNGCWVPPEVSEYGYSGCNDRKTLGSLVGVGCWRTMMRRTTRTTRSATTAMTTTMTTTMTVTKTMMTTTTTTDDDDDGPRR